MNPPLTAKGIRQAEQLAKRCGTMQFDLVISSDLSRAVQTAEKMIAVAACEIVINSAFREIDMGGLHVVFSHSKGTINKNIYGHFALLTSARPQDHNTFDVPNTVKSITTTREIKDGERYCASPSGLFR